MFDNLKLWIAGAVLVVIVGLGFLVRYLYNDNKVLAGQNGVITEVNKNNEKAGDQKAKSDAVNEGTQSGTQAVVKDTETKAGGIKKEADKKQTAVLDTFAKLPVTPTSNKEKNIQIDKIQIDSMWDTYCLSGIVNKNCPVAEVAK